MTTETSGSVMVTAVMQEQNTSFIQDEIQLKKLAKELSRTNKQTIDTLIRLLDSKDEKISSTVAIKLLELNIDIQKAISQDQMQRLIAEIKLNRGVNSKLLKASDTDDDNKPIVDFTRIQVIG